MTTPMESMEQNLYLEFQEILKDITTDITKQVMKEIVTTPLDNLYKQYQSQIPVMSDQTQQLQGAVAHLNQTQAALYEHLEGIIHHVSNQVVEQTVLGKLENLHQFHAAQIPLIQQNNTSLSDLIAEIYQVKLDLSKNLEGLIKDTSNNVLEHSVLAKMNTVYQKYQQQLPLIEKNSRVLEDLITKVGQTKEVLHQDLYQLTADVSRKILQESIMAELGKLYAAHREQLPKILSANKELGNLTQDLKVEQTKLDYRLATLSNNISEEISKNIIQKLTQIYADYQQQVKKVEEQNEQFQTIVQEMKDVKISFTTALNETMKRLDQIQETYEDVQVKINKMNHKIIRRIYLLFGGAVALGMVLVYFAT